MGTTVVPTGTTVVPKMGYYRVLPTYAAEGMRRVRVRVRVRALELSKYCNVSKSNSNKMARAFAEGVK